jgi:hypothetical protein
MSDHVVIAIVVGAVAIVVLVLLRRRLTRFVVDFRRGRVDASMHRDEPLSSGGARQRKIDAAGNVTARDETGVGASQENIKAGGDVSAIVKQPTGGGASKKR